MYPIVSPNGRLIEPCTSDTSLPKGEDAYYRRHSFTWPHPMARLRAGLAGPHLPGILHRTRHPAVSVLK
jgi:hypothetical protein